MVPQEFPEMSRTLRSWDLLGRRMFERELRVSRFLDRNHQRHPFFGTPKRERLADVLVRDGVQILEIVIRTALDHATPELGLLIGIMEVDDGKRDTRIASGVLPFDGAFSGTDQDAGTFTAYPHGNALR